MSERDEPDFRLPAGLSATLVLVRHGESTYVAEGRFQGRLDPPLSALGERQAALVATRLAEHDGGTPLPLPAGTPVGVWHSPLRRAATTAELIARAQPTGVPVHATPGLTEIAQGEWEGELLEDVRSRWPAELSAWRRTPTEAHAPGGESLLAAAERVSNALSNICAELAATAGAANPPVGAASRERDPVPGYRTALSADATADPWAVLVAHDGIFRLALLTLLRVSLRRFWSLPFNLCAITVVGLHNEVAALRAHNLSEHLAPLALEARAAEEARGERRGAL